MYKMNVVVLAVDDGPRELLSSTGGVLIYRFFG